MSIRRETVSSFILVLSGIFFVVYGLNYPLDQWANPGPGVFPLLVGAAWVILALYQLIRSFRMPEPVEWGGGAIERRPLFMIAAFVIYLMMVRWVGFFVSTFLFVIVVSRLFGGKGWVKPIGLSLGINIFCHFLFEVWLKLSFPAGFLF